MLTAQTKQNIRRILCPSVEVWAAMLLELDRISVESPEIEQDITNQVNKILELEEALDEASTGLQRADVIEWNPNRVCSLNRRLNQLKGVLSYTIIGTESPINYFTPFS